MAASEELVGNGSQKRKRRNSMSDTVAKFAAADLVHRPAEKDTHSVPGHGEPRSAEVRAEELAQVLEDEGKDYQADIVRSEHLSELPVFWDGTPGTLVVGMVCREGKESAIVQAIIPCINGTVILGVVFVDGQPHNINVTSPRKHPLSDVADETERRKLWEYDQL